MVTTRRAFRTLFEPARHSPPPGHRGPVEANGGATGRIRRAVAPSAAKTEAGVVPAASPKAQASAAPASVPGQEVERGAKRKRTPRTAARKGTVGAGVSGGASLTAPVALAETGEEKPRVNRKRVKSEGGGAPSWPAPVGWERAYALLTAERDWLAAPVDTVGCEATGATSVRDFTSRRASVPAGPDAGEAGDAGTVHTVERLAEDVAPAPDYSPEELTTRREFATLVALLLSSQTKDAVTAAAVKTLQERLPGGLTAASVAAASDETIQQAISSVGFWRRKTGYLRGVALKLLEREGELCGRPPHSLEELVAFQGVGPKMAHLFLQSIGEGQGIGVDTHVHRIASRLGWTQPLTRPKSTPETTRAQLEAFLPRPLWSHINSLLVGLGQTVCTPVSPRCDMCAVGHHQRMMGRKRGGPLCPSMLPVAQAQSQHRVPIPWRSHADMLSRRAHEETKEWKAALGPTTEIELEVDQFVQQLTAPAAADIKSESDPEAGDAGGGGGGGAGSRQSSPSRTNAAPESATVKEEPLDW